MQNLMKTGFEDIDVEGEEKPASLVKVTNEARLQTYKEPGLAVRACTVRLLVSAHLLIHLAEAWEKLVQVVRLV